jgi:hypothetical protein
MDVEIRRAVRMQGEVLVWGEMERRKLELQVLWDVDVGRYWVL